MRLTFLGTGAGRPSKARNVTAIALSVAEPTNGFWLFDVGEATQHRLMASTLKLNKLDKIFITHMHGDHLYGLPGLLSSRTYFEGAGKLQLYGPPGIQAFVECVFGYSGAHLNYELEIIEIGEGVLFENSKYRVTCAELTHRVPCFGYRIVEQPQPGALDLQKLIQLGVPLGPLYGKLKRGEDITLPSGQSIRSIDVVGPSAVGRVVTILGDTSPSEKSVALAEDADVLVHEATFATGMEDKAAAYGHSTFAQAAQIAVKAKAKRLVLTHFSSRYDAEDVASMVEEVKSAFGNTEAAHDDWTIDIPRP
ncbi:ribonuclease Z [Cohnella panacarvi]|uniref:ribonuclease Z n=1 Tax=Cohnella panacarvi TaxID=400776 RepID=UPI00047AECAE|nr:ribonuclease Z [Cohnella panacarvi]